MKEELPQQSSHVFALSGLGDAPFSICHPGDPLARENTSFFCEHCGTTLKNRFFVKSADGKVSVVGVDCLKKTGDQGLVEGAKRIKQQIRAEKREQAAFEKRCAQESKEREVLGGFSRDEFIEDLQRQIEELSEAHIDVIEDHPVSAMLVQKGFEAAMLERAKAGENFSKGMRNSLVSLIAKKKSDARKGSKAYKAALPESESLVDNFIAVVRDFEAQIEQLKARIRELRVKIF
jgi:hypothetical protein